MAPKRKAAKSSTSKDKKKSKTDSPSEAEATPTPTQTPATSKAKPGGKFTVADAWAAPYVEQGLMTQSGFAAMCEQVELEEMSFEACYLMYLLMPSVEDVMTVCKSKGDLQRAIDNLGCRLVSDLPQKLKSKKASMASFDLHEFQPFYRWMFEMGKSISAMNTGAHVGAVRSVPIAEGLQLMEAVLGSWKLMAKLKEYCEAKVDTPFTMDLWTQIGRFAHLTTTGQIDADLGNYDDDGVSAWPCMIDEFVEWFKAK